MKPGHKFLKNKNEIEQEDSINLTLMLRYLSPVITGNLGIFRMHGFLQDFFKKGGMEGRGRIFAKRNDERVYVDEVHRLRTML